MTTATAQADPNAEAGTGTEAQTAEQIAEAKAKQEAEAKAQKDFDARVTAEVSKRTTPPDKYDLKVPDGSLLEPASVERIAAYAKAQGLSQTQAQALLERESGAAAAVKESQTAQLAAKQTEWLEAAKADQEIGGEAFAKNSELAKRVVARYGSEELKNALDETGLGNHPELVRMLVRIGKSMSEDQLVLPGIASSKTPKKPEDVLYPENPQKE